MRSVFVIFFVLLLSPGSYADPEQGTFTQHYKDSLFKVTQNGQYSVEMVVKEHALRVGTNTIDLIIHDNKDKDVIGADIEITPWMPEMGHGVTEKAVITEKGGGLYRAENVVLSMGGLWELRVTVKKDSIEDNVLFSFPNVPSAYGNERHIHDDAQITDINIVTSQQTAHFTVKYKSNIIPIPINTIHSWELKITTPQGKPVKGAYITIEGDMPAHGHGLPTAPEVTQEIEDGVYLIEGIKFSMPGLWVMKFNIEANDKKDMATFNVVLQ